MHLFGLAEGRADKVLRLPSQRLFAFTLPLHLQGVDAGVSDWNMGRNERVNPRQAYHAGIPS